MTNAYDGRNQVVINSIEYDGFGNRTRITSAAGTVSYTYDLDNRVFSSSAGESWVYDEVGNTTRHNKTGGEYTTSEYDGENRTIQSFSHSYDDGDWSDSTTYMVYDGAGNLVNTQVRAHDYGFDELAYYDVRYNVQRKHITNSYVKGAKYLYGDAYFTYDENGQLTYVDRGRKKGAQNNSAASFAYDNQGHIIARTEQPTAAFDTGFLRGYYVNPDQELVYDTSDIYHTTLSEQARTAVFGWGKTSGELDLTGYVYANGNQVGEASSSQSIALKRLSLQVASLQTNDQETGEILANLVDVSAADIVTTGGGSIDTAQTARNLAQRVYAGFSALSAQAQAKVVAYVQGQIETTISSPYFTELTQVSLYQYIDTTDVVTTQEQLITDYAYQVVGGDEGLPAGVVSQHVVRDGESLQSISMAYYGSPAYWYLIAEANGLDGTEELKAGTTLSIPNAVANSANDKESYKVYSESEIIGSTSPEVRVKQKKKKWYQKLAMIIIAAIIIYVTVVIAPEFSKEVAGYVMEATGSALAAGAAATTAVYAVGVATSAVTQGIAIAAGLQEEFDWKAARDMGKNFAIGNEIAGLNAMAGVTNTTSAVLSRGAIELVRQRIENDGKITNWSGVALAMIGTEVDPNSRWESTLSNINKNRKVLSAGLSVVEKVARGTGVNTLDWTNVASTAIAGQGGVGHYANQAGDLQWSTIAREALFMGGASLIVGDRYGSDAAYEFFGNQLGSIAAGVTGELSAIESLNSNPFLDAEEIAQAFDNKALSAYERQQHLTGLADNRKREIESFVKMVAGQQQADGDWRVDRPDEGRNGAIISASGTNPSDDRLSTGAGVGGPVAQGLSQTRPAEFAAAEMSGLGAGGTGGATRLEAIEVTPNNTEQVTGLTARERKIESYTNLLARAHGAEQISQLVMWDDDFFAQAVDDVRRNGFDSEFAALSGFEMGREDNPNILADALASQREQFAAAILDRADFAGAIATRGLNGVGVDGFEGMSHPEAAKLSSDTINYFGDPASFEGVTREAFQATYAAGLMDYKTHEVVFSTAETGRLDKASLIAGGLTFGASVALNPRAAINAVKGFGRAGLSALNLSAKQLGRLKDVFAGNFAAIVRRNPNKVGFNPASKTGLKFETNIANGEIEILTRQKFVDGKVGGEIKDTRFVKAEIHAKFDESTGDLFIRNMRVDQTGNRIGTELISNVIETVGSNNVKTVSAQLARTNKDVFTYNLEKDLTGIQAFGKTPLGKSLHDLGYKTFDVKNSYPFPLIKATY